MSNVDIKFKNTPKILGLDISTKTIGFALFNLTGSKLLELTHFSPKIKPQPEDKIEELIKKAEAFKNQNFSNHKRKYKNKTMKSRRMSWVVGSTRFAYEGSYF